MVEMRKDLLEKGWSEEDIRRTQDIIRRAPEKKSKSIKVMDNIVQWIGMVLAIIGNFIISILLIPFMIMLKTFFLYAAIIFFGLVFGWVFSIVLRDIENINSGQQIYSWILIPAIALINVYVMTELTNYIGFLLDMRSAIHNSAAISAVYVGSFVLPYFIIKYFSTSSPKPKASLAM